jgi:hypothetical protein
MNEFRAFRFFPFPVLGLGIVGWIALTTWASFIEISTNNYEYIVIAFGIALTAGSMACVVGWAMLLASLIINWSVTARRDYFRRCSIECSSLFAIVTLLGVWSVFFLD